ncbi:hypothetical protein J4210_01505 [Candidatus Woesearchaeota archaeon]|nr:hypothetical protein [Candidatus Woesearchaeota archaeon]
MKKMWFVSVLLAIPFATALDVVGTLGNVWDRILGIGSLNFLGVSAGVGVTALTRILIWILMFTIFFAVMTGLKGATGSTGSIFGLFSRTQAGIVAAVIATIAAIFLPPDVLLATGTGWATAVALLLIGGPIVGLAYLLYTLPGRGQDTKTTVFVKLILCFFLYWILSAMRGYVTQF